MTPLYAPDRIKGGPAPASLEVAGLPVVQSMAFWLLHANPRRGRREALKTLDHQFPCLPEPLKVAAIELWEAHLDRAPVAA